LAGAVNQRSPVPAVCTPNSVPLRASTVTIVEPGTSRAASIASFAVGMPRLRKKCSLPPMNRSTAAMSRDGASTSTMAGDSSRSAISDPARLRLCPSSPICSIWARIALTSIGSPGRPRTASASTGPRTSRIQASRVSTSSSKAPIRRTFPRPSFRFE
jgi:hypothetical protein